MPESRICEGCGKSYWWPAAGWQHEKCATNAATNILANVPEVRLTDATNGIEQSDRDMQGSESEAAGGHSVRERDSGVAGKTQNRRSREAYNAYQRQYMRKYRLTKEV